ncbi:MAG: hypothetical protein WCD89_09145 [Anaerocolumna sp.]
MIDYKTFRRYRNILIIIGIIFLGISLYETVSDITIEGKISDDIEKRISKNHKKNEIFNNFEMLGTKNIENRKIIIIRYYKNDIEDWGYFQYKKMKFNFYKLESFYTNNFEESIRANIRTDRGLYTILCYKTGKIEILR